MIIHCHIAGVLWRPRGEKLIPRGPADLMWRTLHMTVERCTLNLFVIGIHGHIAGVVSRLRQVNNTQALCLIPHRTLVMTAACSGAVLACPEYSG